VSAAQRLLLFLVVLGAVAIALRAVSHRARIPYPVVLAAGGIVVGLFPGHPNIVSPNLILLAFVPGLVFEAAFTLEVAQLRRVLVPVALLATLGVVAVVVAFGAAVHAALGLTLIEGMVLGAVLGPTDPIAVVSVLRAIRAPAAISALLEGESLMNDGTGVALFAALLASLGGGAPSVWDVVIRFAETTGIGIVVGVVWAVAALLVLRSTTEATVEFLSTVTLAYGSYVTADLLRGSGIVAVVSAALVIVLARQRLHLHGERLLDFWEVTGFILNALLFLLIGSALPTSGVLAVAGAIAVGFVLLTAVRVATVLPIISATDWRARRFSWRARALLCWGGMRGALSIALALSLNHLSGVGPAVATLAYGIVVLGLLLQGSTVRLMTGARGLGGRRQH
jgi:CPA1 family monovalent cation:H+ antiporter